MKPIIDISHHQVSSKIDYDLLASQVEAVIIRASYATAVEREFENHYRELSKRGVPMGVYHYIVEYRSAEAQVETFTSRVAGKEFKLGYWADVEIEPNVAPLTKQMVHAWIQQTEAKLGTELGIYTSVSMWQRIMGGAYYTNRKLWVADYRYRQSPQLPPGWDDWWIWQHTSKGKLPGYNGDLDMNRFRFGKEVFDAWIGDTEPTNPVDPEPRLYKAKVTASLGLRVRTCPDTTCRHLHTNPYGTVVSVYENRDEWSRIGTGEWSMSTWLERIDEPEPDPQPEPELVLYSPVAKGTRITQQFGANPGWYPTSKGHNGIDYGTPVGTPVKAMKEGTVEVSQEQVGGYGRHIRIRHEHGVSIYGHLSRRDVKVGDKVVAGQRIGLSGGNLEDPYAGFSTGAHLHAEYRQDKPVVPLVPGSYVYNAIDHLPFIKEEEEEENPMLYQVEVITYALNIRAGVGTRYPIIRTVLKGTILNVYAESQEWLKVGDNQWCSGDSRYVKRLANPPCEPCDKEEKLNKLWEAHPELHE